MRLIILLVISSLVGVFPLHNQTSTDNDFHINEENLIQKRRSSDIERRHFGNEKRILGTRRRGFGHRRRPFGRGRRIWKNWRRPWGNRRRCLFKRERKEIRQMSRKEWKRFVKAINELKKKGIYDDLAEMHRGTDRLKACHGGPNFLGWHRIYLLILEDLLRKEHPCITIPYWDSTLDYDMKDPTQSILWTDAFFGNGDFQVTSGPFANWVTGTGANLTRNIGDGGTLMTKDEIKRIISRSNHSEIMNRTDAMHNIEKIHAGTHVWVDGQLSVISESAEDPIFFLHHAFTDCLWSWFQQKIRREQRIKSYYDYPDPGTNKPHGPNNKMKPFANMKAFKGITNRDGYRPRFYKGLYTCKPMPTCSAFHPSCDSPFLICDQTKYRCVSKNKFLNKETDKGYPWKQTSFSLRNQPAIGRGPRFLSYEEDDRTSGHPLPQKLPDSNFHAKSVHEVLRHLSRDLDIEVEADDGDTNVDFNDDEEDNDDNSIEDDGYFDVIHMI